MLVVFAAITEATTLLVGIFPALAKSDGLFKCFMVNWGMTVLTHLAEGYFMYQDDSGNMAAALQTVVAMDYTVFASKIVDALATNVHLL